MVHYDPIKVCRRLTLNTKKDYIMPVVKGKKYPYTTKGKAAASKARKKKTTKKKK
jgi:hypothetical protein